MHNKTGLKYIVKVSVGKEIEWLEILEKEKWVSQCESREKRKHE
jgi:hypothetical protein